MKPRNPILAVVPVILALMSGSHALQQSGGDSKNDREADRLHRAGLSHYHAGEYEKAIEAYEQAIQLSPRSVETYYNLGMAYGSLGRYRDAVEVYNRALRIEPEYAPAHYNLGHAYSNLKQFEKAIRAFQHAIQYDPDNLEAYLALGKAYSDSGKREKAIDTLEQAIRRKPDDPYVYYNLGLLYFPSGPHAATVDAFTQAISRDPRYPEPYYYRACAYLLLGRGESAAGDAQTYLSLKGWQAEHSLDLALVAYFGHLQARQKAAAIRVLQEAVRKGDKKIWPFRLIEFLLDESSEQLLLELAPDRESVVEARAFIGLTLSLKGDQRAALVHLKWVEDNSRSESFPSALAASEIERIKSSSAVFPEK